MRSREILLAIVTAGALWSAAAAQTKKENLHVDAPPLGSILTGASMQSDRVLPAVIAFKPQMPLGPQDALKAYEIALSPVAEKTSTDFSVILQAQHANQITREQAEYLLQERYQVALMQYQVLSALHDVLRHDIDEAAQQSNRSLKTSGTDEVLVVPLPVSPSGSR